MRCWPPAVRAVPARSTTSPLSATGRGRHQLGARVVVGPVASPSPSCAGLARYVDDVPSQQRRYGRRPPRIRGAPPLIRSPSASVMPSWRRAWSAPCVPRGGIRLGLARRECSSTPVLPTRVWAGGDASWGRAHQESVPSLRLRLSFRRFARQLLARQTRGGGRSVPTGPVTRRAHDALASDDFFFSRSPRLPARDGDRQAFA